VTPQRPALELIEAAPGTPWSPDRVGLHNLAFFVDDLPTEGGLFGVELLAPR
jgi:hypothetical protein